MRAKAVTSIVSAVIMTMAFFVNAAYAQSTSATIQLKIRVVGALSLNVEDEWLHKNLVNPEAETFSELKEHAIYVEKAQRDNSTVWLFTKTE